MTPKRIKKPGATENSAADARMLLRANFTEYEDAVVWNSTASSVLLIIMPVRSLCSQPLSVAGSAGNRPGLMEWIRRVIDLAVSGIG